VYSNFASAQSPNRRRNLGINVNDDTLHPGVSLQLTLHNVVGSRAFRCRRRAREADDESSAGAISRIYGRGGADNVDSLWANSRSVDNTHRAIVLDLLLEMLARKSERLINIH
jgi:hypothetical protein